MKKSIIIILAVVAILVIWAVSVYNGLVTMDENVSGQWANVETQYQRRADLIPNLVNTVKGYATHEKETLEGVVAARSQATQIKVDAADLTPEKLAQYQKAQGAVTSALGKLLSSSSSAISCSICAQITNTSEPSSAASLRTFATCGLFAPSSARSSSETFAA